MNEKLNAEMALLSPRGKDILETIIYLKISQVELADRLGKTLSIFDDIITGKEPLTGIIAMQLEKVLGVSANM